MKIVLAAVTSMLAACGKLLARPMTTARVHIGIFAFLFTVFMLAEAYKFLVLVYKLMIH
jgi:hypothetical protein